ncbi:diaminobutyrate--2-oxoglutarate transaminase [Egicoccus halophilus]|uniref:Diaminobutyrate--2-oxoglutarate transaminase n=1 Tax=Egicoccus halophilus TaxID=1670830 RepID=A0A8J3ADW6_9ACTN|nr:diaminobutyrate--2-oxoglutarate transaminase [Egicoccus halophilus]GGI06426.1 putative diaminobutyrate--2-oxoglutarate aminotransferase [Egicoccus halophilus]
MNLIIDRHESQVRSYCRSWPATFERARGSQVWDTEGRRYLDFFAGAGALNYGHNDPAMRQAVVDYLLADHVVHSLDTYTPAKERFLARFVEVVLAPRGMGAFKVQFPGPTGTNAVEAAMKLARKVTGRDRVIGFTNAFHGMTVGSLAVSGNLGKRGGAGIMLGAGTNLPYDGYFGPDVDTVGYLDSLLEDTGSGLDKPAAVIVETVQAEGGLHTASMTWLRDLQAVCRRHDVLLIVDDIQAGCGRTGTFFSFEPAGVTPDIVTLSKSLSGFGLPMALTLFRPELDVWEPGEHNGTFRGHNPAFVTATEALRFWEDDTLTREVDRKAAMIAQTLDRLAVAHPVLEVERRGRGMVQGLACAEGFATRICAAAFELGLILETSGPRDEVVKLLPALTISDEDLDEGLELLVRAVVAAVPATAPATAATATQPA